MWTLPRELTAQRFALPAKELHRLSEDHELVYMEDEDEAAQWFKASIRKEKGGPRPYPTGEPASDAAQIGDEEEV